MDELTRAQLGAASRGEDPAGALPARGARETAHGRLRRLARALAESRTKGADLSKAKSLEKLLREAGFTVEEYRELAEDPNFWPTLAHEAFAQTPGQYLQAFMQMAEDAAGGDSTARTALFKQMQTVIERGVGEEERYLQGLPDDAYRQELAGVTVSCQRLLSEMDAKSEKRRRAAEALVDKDLETVLEAHDRGDGLSADILFQEQQAQE